MNEPSDDKLWEDYLHRKSALSMGYRRVYIEAPPPELDRTVTARARRALRWIVPGIIAACVAVGILVGVNVGVTRYMNMLVKAQRNLDQLDAERQRKEAEERAKEPVSIIIDPALLNSGKARPAVLSPEAWRAKIDSLKRAGKQAEAEQEIAKFRNAYPEEKPDTK